MGSSLCKPRIRKVMHSSWTSNEGENPFQVSLTKKERLCLRETYHKLIDPKEILGILFIDIINDLCPELKKLFGVELAPRINMLKMPKLGGNVSRMADFIEQMTTMVGFTENLVGAWQLARKTGKLHAKIPFLEENQNQMEKNYFALVNDYLIDNFIPYLTGEQPEPNMDETKEAEKKKRRYSQSYSPAFIADVWKRFFRILTIQLTESFEFERQKCLNSANQRTLAPHQQAEEAERKRRIHAERLSEQASNPPIEERKQEELFEDPF